MSVTQKEHNSVLWIQWEAVKHLSLFGLSQFRASSLTSLLFTASPYHLGFFCHCSTLKLQLSLYSERLTCTCHSLMKTLHPSSIIMLRRRDDYHASMNMSKSTTQLLASALFLSFQSSQQSISISPITLCKGVTLSIFVFQTPVIHLQWSQKCATL